MLRLCGIFNGLCDVQNFYFKKLLRHKHNAPKSVPENLTVESPQEDSANSPVDSALVSLVFDENYYLLENPDLFGLKDNLFHHYVFHGWSEGRSPNKFFDVQWYKEMNRDVDFVSQDPVTHYLKSGETEDRWPNAFFNPKWYSDHYRSWGLDGRSPFIHFLTVGLADGREVSPFFQTRWYQTAYGNEIPPGMHLSTAE